MTHPFRASQQGAPDTHLADLCPSFVWIELEQVTDASVSSWLHYLCHFWKTAFHSTPNLPAFTFLLSLSSFTPADNGTCQRALTQYMCTHVHTYILKRCQLSPSIILPAISFYLLKMSQAKDNLM